MVLAKTDQILPKPGDSDWQVIPNPDPSNITGCTKCGCPVTYAVRHKDGGIIRFYNGRTMTKETAMKLKQELTQQE
jgi:hypothetical protein